MDATLHAKLTIMIHEVTGNESLAVSADSRLDKDLGMDSVDFASLVMALEEEFDSSIDDSELANIKTVGDIVSVIELNLAK